MEALQRLLRELSKHKWRLCSIFGGLKRPKKVLIVFPEGVNGRFTLPSGKIVTFTDVKW